MELRIAPRPCVGRLKAAMLCMWAAGRSSRARAPAGCLLPGCSAARVRVGSSRDAAMHRGGQPSGHAWQGLPGLPAAGGVVALCWRHVPLQPHEALNARLAVPQCLRMPLGRWDRLDPWLW